MRDLTDDIIEQRAEQQAEQGFSTYINENGEVYIEPDGVPEAEADPDVWNQHDCLELYVVAAPGVGLPRPVGTPIRRAFGRVPRRAAVKSVVAGADDDDIGPPTAPSLQVTGEVRHVG